MAHWLRLLAQAGLVPSWLDGSYVALLARMRRALPRWLQCFPFLALNSLYVSRHWFAGGALRTLDHVDSNVVTAQNLYSFLDVYYKLKEIDR